MNKIKHLSETIINKIAAGEVIERPASIVKELIENSIDAGAKNITVEIENGGKRHISVQDDGCGMSEDDIYMSLENHATSKLSNIDDLEFIQTMGFRGEAIPSISAVTKFTIASAQNHGCGFKIWSENGRILKNSPVSMPKGTIITADDIFFNVAARRKFLREDRVEYGKIREIITNFAVYYYNISFFFKSDSKNILTFNAAASKIERISAVWKIPRNFIGFSEISEDGLTVQAYIPSPTESVPAHSVVTVNGRVVSDKTVNKAIVNIFRDTIGGSFKSPVMLFITANPELVDINVHPAKLEVRFLNPASVANLIKNAISQALLSIRVSAENDKKDETMHSENLYSTKVSEKIENTISEEPLFYAPFVKKGDLIKGKIVPKPASEKGFSERIYVPNPIKPLIIADSGELFAEKNNEKKSVSGTNSYCPDPDRENLFSMKLRNYKKIGVVFGVYLVLEMQDKIVFLDQHAAHERITFTALQKAVSMNNGLSQELISPILIRLSPTEAATLEENGEKFRKSGFIIDIFDESSATLRATPALGFETNWEKVIKEMLGELVNYSDSFEMEKFFLSHLAQKACKSSVRRNDVLADEEIDVLIDAVNKSDFISCPHGRPFFFVMTKNEFEKKVQRR